MTLSNQPKERDELAEALALLPEADVDPRFVQRVLVATVYTRQQRRGFARGGAYALRDAMSFGVGVALGGAVLAVLLVGFLGIYGTHGAVISDLHTLMFSARY